MVAEPKTRRRASCRVRLGCEANNRTNQEDPPMVASYAETITDAHPHFAYARVHAAAVERALSSADLTRASFSDVEAYAEQQGREWTRRMLQGYLELQAANEQPVHAVGADGVERPALRRGTERQLETVVGRVTVSRCSYGASGTRSLHPLDAALSLPPELYSFGVRRVVAKEAARASFEEVVELVADHSGAEVAKRQVEQLTVCAARDFDAFYQQRTRACEDTDTLLVISTDAKGIVVRHEDLREPTRAAAAKSAHKLETRLTPGEKSNRKRMTQVCAVYTVDPWQRSAADVVHGMRGEDVEARRPRPRDKRVWASIEKAPRKVVREAFEEAQRRDPEHRRRWVVLVDGEPKQLRAVKAEVRRAEVEVEIIVDIVHVIEYLWLAGRALFGESNPEAESWVGDRLLALLSGRTGGEVARTIRWWASQREAQLDATARKAIGRATRYLADRTRTRLMHYADALRDGLPIATGVIEGACRYLVKDRMDRTGARWSLHGAEAILRLRALRTSGDFDEYWHFHLAREHERNHVGRYANGQIPDPLPRPKPRLRRVK